MIVSNRTVKLLHILAEEKNFISIEKLSSRMKLSQRTVYRELDDGKCLCDKYGIVIECISKQGIRLCGDPDEVQRMLAELRKAEICLIDMDDRVNHILVKLLHEKEYVTLEELTEELNASMSTIRSDIAQAEKISRYSGVCLQKNRGKGVRLDGAQTARDKLFLNILLGNMDMDIFYQYLKSPDGRKTWRNREAIAFLENYQYVPYIQKCNQLFYTMNRELEAVGFRFEKTYYIEFILLLSFFLRNRDESGSSYMTDIDTSREPSEIFVHYVVYQLEVLFDITVSKDEKKYIAWIVSICIFPQKVSTESGLEEKIRIMIRQTEEHYGKKLFFDENTAKQLAIHMKNAMVRIDNHITIVNSLLEYIQKEMAELFLTVEQALKEVFPEIVFPDAEVGYIVLYFALIIEKMKNCTFRLRVLTVCSGGMGSSRMLANRLEYEIPEIGSVKCLSVAELESIDPRDYDLILSTIPLYIQNIEYMRISALLSEKEVKLIRKKLQEISSESRGIMNE